MGQDIISHEAVTPATPSAGFTTIYPKSPSGEIFRKLPSGAEAQLLTSVSVTIFGDEFQKAESLALDTTTLDTFVSKLLLTTGIVPAGDYRIGWNFGWSHSATNRNYLSRMFQDGTTELWTHIARPVTSGADQIFRNSGFAIVTLTNAVHTFDLQFRASQAGDTARITEARSEIWRVL